ncbi:hypothetical protein H6P81_018977 [Aristolochia fimbriata]|uniref:Uncharacterized protein n=1 Tax=Aristolochia fimbriata TaxID=158543 RepID=A0AAV7E2S4_ARIFI|nr:hypothetical protein H6P81_018977 [Aristolochia fimbriata]
MNGQLCKGNPETGTSDGAKMKVVIIKSEDIWYMKIYESSNGDATFKLYEDEKRSFLTLEEVSIWKGLLYALSIRKRSCFASQIPSSGISKLPILSVEGSYFIIDGKEECFMHLDPGTLDASLSQVEEKCRAREDSKKPKRKKVL